MVADYTANIYKHAAYICDDLAFAGYDDPFLQDKNELDLMC